MAGSSFGKLLRVTTFGESHGQALGVVVDGSPPGVELSEADVQHQLDRRRPGQSQATTQRRERDTIRILSGVFEGLTTGAPIGMVLFNEDQRSEAYDGLKDVLRPGHADFTYIGKYGLRDWRGGGRSSGRETAGRVAGGAVARKLLARRGVAVQAFVLRAAGVQCRTIDLSQVERNPMRAADAQAAEEMLARLQQARDRGDSVGGIVECRVSGVPAGLGEPVFDKLDAEIAKAMLSLGAVKGIEFGTGFAAVDMCGSQHNDQMGADGFLTNHAGGVLGGISTGQEIVFRLAVKPTPSVSLPQQTQDNSGQVRTIRIEGRHDPCVCPRIVPVVEAMACLVLEDHFMRCQAAGTGPARPKA